MGLISFCDSVTIQSTSFNIVHCKQEMDSFSENCFNFKKDRESIVLVYTLDTHVIYSILHFPHHDTPFMYAFDSIIVRKNSNQPSIPALRNYYLKPRRLHYPTMTTCPGITDYPRSLPTACLQS